MTIYKKYISAFHNVVDKLIINDFDANVLSKDQALLIIHKNFDTVKKNNNAVYIIGNGGSSGIASHASVDLLNTCKIKAIPFTDNSQITCFANDFGYENVYCKALETIISANDILIAISSSGSSKNIINAVKTARNNKSFIITLSGFKEDNPLRKSGDVNFWLDSTHYGMVEIGHSLILHYISDSYSNLLSF